MYQTLPAHFSSLQLREKGYDNPVEGKKAHGRGERERGRYGLITLILVSAVTSWPCLERFRTVMISQALFYRRSLLGNHSAINLAAPQGPFWLLPPLCPL